MFEKGTYSCLKQILFTPVLVISGCRHSPLQPGLAIYPVSVVNFISFQQISSSVLLMCSPIKVTLWQRYESKCGAGEHSGLLFVICSKLLKYSTLLLICEYLRNEFSSVNIALSPLDWQRTVQQPPHKTTICTWLKSVVILQHPGHVKQELVSAAGAASCISCSFLQRDGGAPLLEVSSPGESSWLERLVSLSFIYIGRILLA